MQSSPEILRATRISTGVLFALGSLSLAFQDGNNIETVHPPMVAVEALPPVVNETTTTSVNILPPTTVAERVVAPRSSRSTPSSQPRAITKPTAAPVIIQGTHVEWMEQAGIAPENYDEVDYIFTKESNWRPYAVNSKGCIGLGQNCPDKYGFKWLEQACPDWRTNVVCQIKRFAHYAIGRYGSWEAARAHKVRTGWW